MYSLPVISRRNLIYANNDDQLRPGHQGSCQPIRLRHADSKIPLLRCRCALGCLVDLEMEVDFIGKAALSAIAQKSASRLQVGLEIDRDPLPGPNAEFWPITVAGERVGQVTSAVYSPRLRSSIALAMVQIEHSSIDTRVEIDMPTEGRAEAFLRPEEKPAEKPIR